MTVFKAEERDQQGYLHSLKSPRCAPHIKISMKVGDTKCDLAKLYIVLFVTQLQYIIVPFY